MTLSSKKATLLLCFSILKLQSNTWKSLGLQCKRNSPIDKKGLKSYRRAGFLHACTTTHLIYALQAILNYLQTHFQSLQLFFFKKVREVPIWRALKSFSCKNGNARAVQLFQIIGNSRDFILNLLYSLDSNLKSRKGTVGFS